MPPALDADTRDMLDGVADRESAMRDCLRRWSNHNSGSENLTGVCRQRELVAEAVANLADTVELVALPDRKVVKADGELESIPVAEALVVRKRPDRPHRVLLNGHLDTVFGIDSSFQTVREVSADRWVGPGVADLKGGLVVLTEALRAFERHPMASRVGWTAVFNPDEELGSPSSTSLLHKLASEHQIGLVFEPALEDGRLAGARGGSGSFDLVIRGRSAHVGREFDQGRSAMHVAGEVVSLLADFNKADGVTVNVGRIDGGGPVNRVADLAIVRFNVRVATEERREAMENDLRRLAFVLGRRDGIEATMHGSFFSPPKPMTPETTRLFERVRSCGAHLDLEVHWRDTGGVCDGNKLQAAGLPTVDTMGVRGGGLHTDEEFVVLPSLVERTRLAALVLASFAGESPAP